MDFVFLVFRVKKQASSQADTFYTIPTRYIDDRVISIHLKTCIRTHFWKIININTKKNRTQNCSLRNSYIAILWGTDLTLLMTTLCSQLFKYESNHDRDRFDILYFVIFDIKILWFMEKQNSAILNAYDKGGLNLIDFSSLNSNFKINWIRQYLQNSSSIWNIIPLFVFSHLGGLEFLLMCNYKIEKLPIKLSKFYQQVLATWSLIYKHSLSPQSFLILNNANIFYRNKSLFFHNWFSNGLLLVSQLFNNDFIYICRLYLKIQNTD